MVHGALARHRAPVAQHHEKAGQAVEQRCQRRRWLFKTQETNKRPLGENKIHHSFSSDYSHGVIVLTYMMIKYTLGALVERLTLPWNCGTL